MKTKLHSLLLLAALVPAIPAFAEEEKKDAAAHPAAEATAEPDTIATALKDSATFSILTKALQAADLYETLGSKGSYTVFAPTDEAFGKLPAGALDQLLLPENKMKLRSLLMYHVVHGTMKASDFKDGDLKASNGDKLEIDVDPDGIEVDDAKVSKADLVLGNGVVHSIDRVIVPESLDGFAGLDD